MVEEEPSIIHILSHKHFQHFLLSTAFLFSTKYALNWPHDWVWNKSSRLHFGFEIRSKKTLKTEWRANSWKQRLHCLAMNKGSKCCRRYCKLEFKISTWLEQKKVWLRLTSYSLLESSFKCKWGQSWMTTPIKDLWKSLIFKRLSSSENFFEQHFFMLSPPKRRRFSRAENLHVTQKQQQQAAAEKVEFEHKRK